MTMAEIFTIVTSSIMAITSIVMCVISVRAKKDVKKSKEEINTTKDEITRFCEEQKNVLNQGENKGVMANTVNGGVKIGSSE